MGGSSEGRPLAGLRVLDLSRLLPGPLATMILADLGAEVDKLEDPKGGDYLRHMPPQAPDGMSAAFHLLNGSKRSLVLDLKQEEGRAAFLRLLPRYDVLIESFRPGVLGRMGLSHEALLEAHPGLICAALSGYGQDGPMAQRAGHDIGYLARSGVLGLTGPQTGPPQVPGAQLADTGGALFALIGILAGLRERDRTGRGKVIDVSLCESAMIFGLFGLGQKLAGFELPRGADVIMGGIAPYRTYATKDGQAVALGALEPKFWGAFCEGVGIETDASALFPGPHQAEWMARLERIFEARTRAEWEAFAAARDCCLEPVLDPLELIDDPHHRARRLFADKPIGATILHQPRSPIAPSAEGEAPRQGQHSEAILREAGFESAEIEALRSAGITR
ncbi:MAG: CoA transferase [Myxococcales bacterium]|nr:CoA transferase [Myxococcales bacterium]